MNLSLVRLAILQIMHGTLFWITLASIKVVAAESPYDYKDFSNVGLEPRIRGGRLASEGEFPWQAGLLCNRKVFKVKLGPLRNNTFAVEHLDYTGYTFNGFYGATLISDRYLLTAAHMIWDYNRQKRITTITTECIVKFGTLNIYHRDNKYRTKKIIAHPEWDMYHDLRPLWNDIAIVELPKSVSFTKYIYPVQLPVSPIESENKTVIASGYGQCYGNKPLDGFLRYVRIRILPTKECRKNVHENQICTEPYRFIRLGERARSVGICWGDSGGPLVISTPRKDENGEWMDTYTLLGLTSYSYINCTGPSIFTRVSSYMSFIRQNTNL